jgi:hypothetical protein
VGKVGRKTQILYADMNKIKIKNAGWDEPQWYSVSCLPSMYKALGLIHSNTHTLIKK